MCPAPSQRSGSVPTVKTGRMVRVHWVMGDGRPVCLYDGERRSLPDDERAATPFCGACLIVLVHLRVHSELMWETCAPPDLRPSQAIELLRGTAWEGMFSLDAPAGTDTWWFETAS